MVLDGLATLLIQRIANPEWNDLVGTWDDQAEDWDEEGPNVGVFPVELPRNYISVLNPLAIVYKRILSRPTYVLEGQTSYTELEIQLDCHGYGTSPAPAIKLATAVQGILRGGCQGNLPDRDQTYVHGIFQQSTLTDFYNQYSKTFVTILEYKIIYDQT